MRNRFGHQRASLAAVIAVNLMATGLLSGCDGTPISEDQILCDSLDGRIFSVAELHEMGFSEAGLAMGHWRAEFRRGTVFFTQSDANLALTYQCESGVVSVTRNEVNEPVAFNEAHDAFDFAPLGSAVHYQEIEKPAAVTTCQQVRGREFQYASFTPPSDFVPDPNVSIAQPIIHLNFGTNDVAIERGGQQATGYFDCDWGVMHVHMSESDTAPMPAHLDSTGTELTVRWAGVDVHFVAADGDQSSQSSASSSSDPFSSPTHCVEYGIVCTLITDDRPCEGLPCPAPRYFTYANDCTAPSDAMRVFYGDCGELEGTTPTELPTACTAQYAPVCAKLPSERVCITAPCDSNPYRTFGNACEAQAKLAQVAFAGECGALENVYGENIQAAQIVEQLPTPRKNVSIVASEIRGDELIVKLGYSGCGEQNFQLMVDDSLVNNGQALNLMFQAAVSDNCEAAPTVQLRYDLKPIATYFNVSEQGIELPGIGQYRPTVANQ